MRGFDAKAVGKRKSPLVSTNEWWVSVFYNSAVDVDMQSGCFGLLSQFFLRLQRELCWDVSTPSHDDGQLQAGKWDASRCCTTADGLLAEMSPTESFLS